MGRVRPGVKFPALGGTERRDRLTGDTNIGDTGRDYVGSR